MERTYHFTVILAGTGKTVEEAWADAVEGFSLDPGIPDDYEIINDEDDEEGE